MDYPILIEEKEAGRLSVRREGLYTVFEARLPASGELTRLWVVGGGESACLGLMEPRKEERYLYRRLSGAAMRGFPPQIEYAATAEPVRIWEPTVEAATAEPPEETENGGDDGRLPASTGPPEPPDRPEETPSDGLLWFTRPDGSLTAFDGAGSLIALPVSLRCRGPGLRLRTIGGREYMVFRY